MEGIKLCVRSVQTVRFDKPLKPPLKWGGIYIRSAFDEMQFPNQ